MRRDARASEESRYLSAMLYPHRHMQERFYSILPFLAQHGAEHGLDLVDRLYEVVQWIARTIAWLRFSRYSQISTRRGRSLGSQLPLEHCSSSFGAYTDSQPAFTVYSYPVAFSG